MGIQQKDQDINRITDTEVLDQADRLDLPEVIRRQRMNYFIRALLYSPYQLRLILDILLCHKGPWMETLREDFEWLETYMDRQARVTCYGIDNWVKWFRQNEQEAKKLYNTLWRAATDYNTEHIRHEAWKKGYYNRLGLMDVKLPEECNRLTTPTEVYACPECPAKLTTVGSWKIHMTQYHPTPHPIKNYVDS